MNASKVFRFVLYRILYPTCLIFTCILFVFAGIAASGAVRLAPTLSSMGLFLGCSFLISLCNLLLHLPKCHVAIRLLLHYACLMASVFLVLVAASDNTDKTRALIALGIIYTFCYLIFAAIYAVVTRRRAMRGQKKEGAEQYKQQFNRL